MENGQVTIRGRLGFDEHLDLLNWLEKERLAGKLNWLTLEIDEKRREGGFNTYTVQVAIDPIPAFSLYRKQLDTLLLLFGFGEAPLTKCPKCSGKIYDHVDARCDNCGYSVKEAIQEGDQ